MDELTCIVVIPGVGHERCGLSRTLRLKILFRDDPASLELFKCDLGQISTRLPYLAIQAAEHFYFLAGLQGRCHSYHIDGIGLLFCNFRATSLAQPIRFLYHQ